eukprot:5025267-Prorocentrum_lima.AAC.1
MGGPFWRKTFGASVMRGGMWCCVCVANWQHCPSVLEEAARWRCIGGVAAVPVGEDSGGRFSS